MVALVKVVILDLLIEQFPLTLPAARSRWVRPSFGAFASIGVLPGRDSPSVEGVGY